MLRSCLESSKSKAQLLKLQVVTHIGALNVSALKIWHTECAITKKVTQDHLHREESSFLQCSPVSCPVISPQPWFRRLALHCAITSHTANQRSPKYLRASSWRSGVVCCHVLLRVQNVLLPLCLNHGKQRQYFPMTVLQHLSIILNTKAFQSL